jgi:folate-dependent phosphoribosylglycinamide formyltransferase PurN
LKIVILATQGLTTWMVVNALKVEYDDITLVIERPVSKFRLLKNRIPKQGLIKVLGQFLFLVYLSFIRLVKKRFYDQIIYSSPLNAICARDVSVVEVESVNTHECEVLLKSLNPDLVVVNGTRILGEGVLKSCKTIFLNIHCGITPAYRGVHGGYWACVCGDGKNAGVTIHTVDVGVDTGDIVYQAPISIDASDDFLTYPIKQYIAGVPLLLRAISDFCAGSLKTYKRHDLNSNIWFHPTLWFYVWTRISKGVR